MSFLAPLYVLGALGIGLPVLFHLIRRQPRDQRPFSSLIFLKPTPPTLTKRTRLDNWPLLLIRALALLLLASAFARPFFRSPVLEDQAAIGKRIVLVIDTSASMRRTGLWQQAIQESAALIKKLMPADQIAIVSLSSKPRMEMSFEQSSSLEFGARVQAANQAIQQLKPTWESGELGAGLVLAAETLTTSEVDDVTAGQERSPTTGDGHIVVISDYQIGGDNNLEGLQAFRWPKEIKVEIRPIFVDQRSNAFATILQTEEDGTDENEKTKTSADRNLNRDVTRVRIANSTDATKSDLSVFWSDNNGKPIEATRMPTHVSPGETRVVRLLDPPGADDTNQMLQLVVEGDSHDFDNIRYVVRPKKQSLELLFVGSVAGAPQENLGYYLERAPLGNRSRTVALITKRPSELPDSIDTKKTPLVVIAGSVEEPQIKTLSRYISDGGSVLWILDAKSDLAKTQIALRAIGDAPSLVVSASTVTDYSMWSKIDFGHPLFEPFADARYNDFTKIHFWSHRDLAEVPADFRRIVSFDDGTPAIVERSIGKGRLWIMTAGWQPTDSQLALSSKFVPLLLGMLGVAVETQLTTSSFTLGNLLPFTPSVNATIKGSNESSWPYRDLSHGEQVDAPGIYRFVDRDEEHPFALNIDLDESKTELMDSGELERLGVRLGTFEENEPSVASQRLKRDVELEGPQRIWQWLLVGVLGLLGIESLMSGLVDRRRIKHASMRDDA